MDLQYFLITIGVFLGIYFGTVLAMIAPEELKIGQKYFQWLYLGLLAITISVFSWAIFEELWFAIIFGIILFLVLLKLNDKFVYTIMAILIFVANKNGKIGIVASFVLLLGLPIATMFCLRYEKNEELNEKRIIIIKEVTKNYWWFVLISAILSLFVR